MYLEKSEIVQRTEAEAQQHIGRVLTEEQKTDKELELVAHAWRVGGGALPISAAPSPSAQLVLQ